jgi:hypothetical protein
MKRIVSLIGLLTLLLIIVFFISSSLTECSQINTPPANENKEEQAEKVSKEQDSQSKIVKSDKSTTPTLPEGWPLPFNEKIVLDGSDSKDVNGLKVWQIMGTYPGSAQEIYNWYKENLEDWTIIDDAVVSNEYDFKDYSYNISNDKYKAMLAFSDLGKEEAKVILYVEESSGNTSPLEGWPLPFNDKIVLSDSKIIDEGNHKTWDMFGAFPGSAQEIYDWYKTKFDGWTVDNTKEDPGLYEYRVSNDNFRAILTFADNGKNSCIVHLNAEEKEK